MSGKLFSFVSILIVICLYMPFYAQEFEISEYSTNKYSVDRKTQIVYYEYMWTGDIYEYDFKTQLTNPSRFEEVPIFANKNHLCLSSDGSGIATLFDLETDSTCYVYLDITSLFISFSPNDSGIVWGGDFSVTEFTGFYSLSRERNYDKIPKDLTWNPPPCWSSDSTMMFLNTNGDVIENVNLFTGKRDTLLASSDELILWFNYKIGTEYITYSMTDEPDYSRKLRRYYCNEQRDSIVFDLSGQNLSPSGFTNMQWSPDNRRMAFFLTMYIGHGTDIFCYSVDSNNTYRYTKNEEYGRKYNLDWLNNDTILYADYTVDAIYAFKIDQPYTMVEDFDIFNTYQINITNYPNPFNNTTNFVVSTSIRGEAQITIFNVLGETIYQTDLGYIKAGQKTIRWDGLNYNGCSLSSGIYLVRLNITDEKGVAHTTNNKILLTK